jgi:uncharacterized protein
MQDKSILTLFRDQLGVMITMFFGAFIAGSSPEGSASIAYPVFTLFLSISPADARNFGFAIQSIGMTAASIYILSKKIRLEWSYITYVIIGGIVGLLLGTFFIIPMISPPAAKLLFVSLWLSFAIVLFFQNRNPQRVVLHSLTLLRSREILLLISFGIIGGMISSLFGTGINIFTFCLMVTYFHIDEKVATASSILIMTMETIAGFMLHRFILRDFSDQSHQMWIACIPIVIVMAPLGSFVLSKISRLQLANFLYAILLLQFIGAIWVIRPGPGLLTICILVIVTGFFLFRYLAGLKSSQQKIETS